MNPISPITATLWAESKNRRPRSMILSALDTRVSVALRCAARNRATLSSGVSVAMILGLGVLGARPPSPVAAANFGSAGLELACGVAAVKRVASETLRGVVFIAMGKGLSALHGQSGDGTS